MSKTQTKYVAQGNVVSQMEYIIANANTLDIPTKKSIFGIVMMEVGRFAVVDGKKVPVVLENEKTKEPTIVLSNINNPSVIGHIWNIVKNRLEVLNQPIKYAPKTEK